MAKYIDADKLSIDLKENGIWTKERDRTEAIIILNRQPAAEIEEVKRGNWDECEEGLFYSCSMCGYLVEYQLSNYCPNCGAKMTGQRSKDIIPECEHCNDEICVNDQCPMCADYCPVPDIPEVCKYEERGRMETEKKQKKES